jgi:hypothetical protein
MDLFALYQIGAMVSLAAVPGNSEKEGKDYRRWLYHSQQNQDGIILKEAPWQCCPTLRTRVYGMSTGFKGLPATGSVSILACVVLCHIPLAAMIPQQLSV